MPQNIPIVQFEKKPHPVPGTNKKWPIADTILLRANEREFTVAKVAFQYLQGYVGQAWCRRVEHTADTYPE